MINDNDDKYDDPDIHCGNILSPLFEIMRFDLQKYDDNRVNANLANEMVFDYTFQSW